MLEHPQAIGRNVYQVAVYNKEVRALVKDNCSHCHYNDAWATPRYQEVCACSEEEARDIVTRRFPPECGFVVVEVVSQ